ncbi:SDR family oxidoreductase [Streptomyces sp. NPDC017260]|uniref:SDR family oxidoreductase n=1 Tax=unclassified Streptomyces TaxID=2593676 RepID=UPI00378900DB
MAHADTAQPCAAPPRSRTHQTRPGRVGSPDDVVNAGVVLACDEAAYIHGAGLVVDGGWSTVLPGTTT